MNALFRDPQPVEVFGAQSAATYQLDDNPSIFSLLSDVVYSKPNLAIVREYLTNGWDSHKEANATDAALEVHITETPPRILFKDFGTGLDHDGMMNVFRYFFRTTKNDNPDATGRLGIGSKVAFAATDAFTAIGVKQGRRHVFANAKGPDGRPLLNTMTPVPAGVPTDEPNGVTIDIPLSDAKVIPDLIAYVQDLRAVSTMKIRLYRAGREVEAPAHCFGDTLREHGFAYATPRISDAWGPTAPCVVQGEIPYSGQPFGARASIPLGNLYIHAPPRAFQFTLSREQLRLTERGAADFTALLSKVETAIEEAYFALLCEATARAPIYVMVALCQKLTRTAYFQSTSGDSNVFAGPTEAARYIAATGADEHLFEAVEQRLIARYLNRSFADLASARAALRRKALKAISQVAIEIAPKATADLPFTRYAVTSRGYPPISPSSKSYVYLDERNFRSQRRGFTPTALLTSSTLDPAVRRRIMRQHTAEELLLAAASGNTGIIVRRASVKNLHLMASDAKLPAHFYVITAPTKSDQPLANFVPPRLVQRLQQFAGRAGVFFDEMPQLGARTPATPREPRLALPKVAKPKAMQIVNYADWDYGSRVAAEKIRLFAIPAPATVAPLFFINVSPYRLKDGYYRIPRDGKHFTFMKGLALHARHRIALATTPEQAAELEASGLHRIAVPGRDPAREVDDPIALRLAAWLTNVDRVKDTHFGASSNWEPAIRHVLYADFATCWGKSIETAIVEHAAQFARASFSLSTAVARSLAADEWLTFAQQRPILAFPKNPARLASIKMMRRLAPDIDPAGYSAFFKD